MLIHEIQAEIRRLKREKGVCILAHAYQSHDIWEVADYVGDSFGLSQKAAESDADTVLMCGVRFMAETVKILSPQKRVILANGEAGCPMAEQISVDLLRSLKEKYPDHTVVSYIKNQAEHHRKQSFKEEYISFLRLYKVEYDERYVLSD